MGVRAQQHHALTNSVKCEESGESGVSGDLGLAERVTYFHSPLDPEGQVGVAWLWLCGLRIPAPTIIHIRHTPSPSFLVLPLFPSPHLSSTHFPTSTRASLRLSLILALISLTTTSQDAGP